MPAKKRVAKKVARRSPRPRKAGGWFAIVDALTGDAVSFADGAAPTLRPGYALVSIAGPPNFKTHDWDAGTRTLVAKPTRAKRKALVDALDDDAEFQGLANKAAVRRILTRLVGTKATVAIEAAED